MRAFLIMPAVFSLLPIWEAEDPFVITKLIFDEEFETGLELALHIKIANTAPITKTTGTI